ncbi:MAG: hypothetical protein BGP12_02510 [Rhodospirillales bacterium 70-18]|mgnify:CR=1 FL=1|nr:MAG: hypothetical protein BGP12_02510 [Rhodospirillales bacterium 70-18]
MTREPTAIVIFGAAVRPDGTPSRALRLRTEAAFAAGTALREPLFVPTGGVGRHGPSEASVMAGLLGAHGVPDARILVEDTATSTLTSVRAVRRLLRAAGHRGPVLAASSAYHLPRCVALLRLAGLPARAAPPPAVPAARSLRKRWFWRLREAVALPVDAALLLALRLGGRF